MIKKSKEWNQIMFPFRQARKELFCQSVRERLNPTFSKVDIISGLMEAGYSDYEATHFCNVIEEVRRGVLMQREGKE